MEQSPPLTCCQIGKSCGRPIILEAPKGKQRRDASERRRAKPAWRANFEKIANQIKTKLLTVCRWQLFTLRAVQSKSRAPRLSVCSPVMNGQQLDTCLCLSSAGASNAEYVCDAGDGYCKCRRESLCAGAGKQCLSRQSSDYLVVRFASLSISRQTQTIANSPEQRQSVCASNLLLAHPIGQKVALEIIAVIRNNLLRVAVDCLSVAG